MSDHRARIKRAELLSTVGAAVLGGGAALVLEKWLAAHAVPIIVVGLVAHAWGMFDKHRIESGSAVERARWEDVLYWSCWILLGALGAALAFGSIR